MLDVEQKREMIQFVLETEQQQGFSAIPCTNPDSFGARIDTSQPLTEIREGDLYFCLEEREVAVQGKKVDLSVREFNALYLLLMNRRRVMTFETIAYHVWSEEYARTFQIILSVCAVLDINLTQRSKRSEITTS